MLLLTLGKLQQTVRGDQGGEEAVRTKTKQPLHKRQRLTLVVSPPCSALSHMILLFDSAATTSSSIQTIQQWWVFFSDNDKSAYRMELEQLAAWSRSHSLALNVDKIREMVIIFKRASGGLAITITHR